MYRRVASQRGCSSCACSQSLWLQFSRVLERWAAAAWTSGSGAVGCKGAVGGGESDLRPGGVDVEPDEARRPVEVVEPRRVDRV